MAQLASEMRQIKSFLHVSTAYVNCHLGRNVHVEERQYPFSVDGRPVAHADIIAELAALPADDAERRVSRLAPLELRHSKMALCCCWCSKVGARVGGKVGGNSATHCQLQRPMPGPMH